MIENYSVSSQLLVELGGVFLLLFALIGAFDGIYFHLIKYELHLHPASRLEHKIHTLRAFLFIPIVYFLFARNSTGLELWVGIFFTILDLGVEVVDVLIEKEARRMLGGISSMETLVHIGATSCRVLAVALILLSKTPEAYGLGNFAREGLSYPPLLVHFSYLFIGATLLGGLTQIGLEKQFGITRRRSPSFF